MTSASVAKPANAAAAAESHSPSKQSANNDWLLCARWLNDCRCLPVPVQQRLLSNELTLGEFANALRDGEILCILANFLIPGSIDVTQINRKAHNSQMLCLKNIRLFLDACTSPALFNLNESDLFDEHMLYELDLARVIQALSILSKTKASQNRGCGHFSLMSAGEKAHPSAASTNGISSRPSSTSLTSTSNLNDDIYYNILPTELLETPESYYTDESFLFGSQLNDSHNQSDDGVYQIIVQQQTSVQPLKRDFVIREILNTEENFVNGLDTLWADFLKPLSEILNDEDQKCICINIKELIQLHKRLYGDLFQSCKGGAGRTQRICQVFEKVKLDIMKEYAEYFSCIDRSLAKCDSLTNSINQSSSLYGNAKSGNYANEFRSKLEECRKKSKRGNFKLTDLLRLPYQRVLKYHLLFNELLKQTDIEHSAKEQIEITRDSMRDVGNFLNECQRDKENLTQIEKIMAHLIIDTKGSSSSGLKENYGRIINDEKFRIKSLDSGERIARTRTFFLFEKALIICKAKSDLYNYKETLLIDEFTFEDPLAMPHSTSSTLDSSNGAVNLSLIGGGGANAHSLNVYNKNRTKDYVFYFKNQEQKRVWKESLSKAKSKIEPLGQRNNKHLFLFTDFKHEMVPCFVCNKFLLGIFYQGYRCKLCNQIAHKDCLTMTSLCEVGANRCSRNPSMTSSIPNFPRSDSTVSTSSTKLPQQAFCVRAIYRYDGRPNPPELPVLMFNEGDLIQVTDDDDDYWWKGFLIKFKRAQAQNPTKEEGYFPSSYVRMYTREPSISNQIQDEYSWKNEPWFAAVDRITADLILNRIQNFPAQTLFMVRCRQEGGYAISIKCNGLVDHIKINVTFLDQLGNTLGSRVSSMNLNGTAEPTSYYSIDQRNFSSIVGLVNWYCQNTLKENFPQLETTLGVPYRDALPSAMSIAIAMHDYDPLTNPNNTGEQIELRTGCTYFILNKEPNGWWRVYNSDGLIGYAPGGYLRDEARYQ